MSEFGKHLLDDDYVEDISIIMAVYNHADTIAEAIESVLNQKTQYRYVLYCLDDASTDHSADILQHYSEKYPDKIKIFTSPQNLGTGKKSFLYHNPPVNGKYWALLAGDDYWTDNHKLDEQLTFLEDNSCYVGCGSHTYVKDEINGADSTIKPSKSSFNLIDFHVHSNLYTHPSSIIWRNIYRDEVTFLPPLFRKKTAVGDVMLMNAMLASGSKMKILVKVMSCYRVTGEGVWSRLSKEEQDHLNNNLMGNIMQMLPIKWRLIIFFQKQRQQSMLLQTMIPGPKNER